MKNDKCMECGAVGTSKPSMNEASETTFTRNGPYWEQNSSSSSTAPVAKSQHVHAPVASGAKQSSQGNVSKPPVAKSDMSASAIGMEDNRGGDRVPPPNVIITADGRTKNTYKNKPGAGPKICSSCGALSTGATCTCGAAMGGSIF